MEDSLQLIVSGSVVFNGNRETNGVDKRSILITITEEQHGLIQEALGDTGAYDSIPIKYDPEKSNPFSFKGHSMFEIPVFENKNGVNKLSDIDIEEIGRDSDVSLSVKIVETKYKKKKFLSAYITAILVSDIIAPTPFNPFDEADFVNI